MDSCDSTGRSTPSGGASVIECVNIHDIPVIECANIHDRSAIEYTTAVRESSPGCVV